MCLLGHACISFWTWGAHWLHAASSMHRAQHMPPCNHDVCDLASMLCRVDRSFWPDRYVFPLSPHGIPCHEAHDKPCCITHVPQKPHAKDHTCKFHSQAEGTAGVTGANLVTRFYYKNAPQVNIATSLCLLHCTLEKHMPHFQTSLRLSHRAQTLTCPMQSFIAPAAGNYLFIVAGGGGRSLGSRNTRRARGHSRSHRVSAVWRHNPHHCGGSRR